MIYYEIKRIQHKYRDGTPVRPMFHAISLPSRETVFSSPDEEVVKDVVDLLNKARTERLARTEATEMSKEEINAWTDGPWECVCGAVIDGSFGCPECGLTVIGSNMERLRREREEE